jgi:hypothetical protein
MGDGGARATVSGSQFTEFGTSGLRISPVNESPVREQFFGQIDGHEAIIR